MSGTKREVVAKAIQIVVAHLKNRLDPPVRIRGVFFRFADKGLTPLDPTPLSGDFASENVTSFLFASLVTLNQFVRKGVKFNRACAASLI